MAEEIPVQEIAFISEWMFSTTMTPPTTTGQVRFNNNNQKNVTTIWIDKVTINGNDAAVYLTTLKSGSDIRLNDKIDPAKWQTYAITANPIDKGTYLECPVLWKAGGTTLLAARIIVDLPLVDASVNVTGFSLTMSQGYVDIRGQLITRDFAYPFDGKNYTSPGMTLRQWYAGQALIGFLSNGGPISNLIGGKGIEYCFQVADNMIAFERKEAEGQQPPLVGAPRRVA